MLSLSHSTVTSQRVLMLLLRQLFSYGIPTSSLLFRSRTPVVPHPSSWSTLPSSSSRRLFAPRNRAVDREEAETPYEIDRKKALEALQQLDEQLDTLSQQEETKKRAPPPVMPELNLDRDLFASMRGEAPEISVSYLAYTTVALVLLTVFNNIMFNILIKPSVDGQEQVSKLERVPLSEPREQLLPKVTE